VWVLNPINCGNLGFLEYARLLSDSYEIFRFYERLYATFILIIWSLLLNRYELFYNIYRGGCVVYPCIVSFQVEILYTN